MSDVVVIIGAGPGLSASLARTFASTGKKVVLAARNTDKLADLCSETGAVAVACDCTDHQAVAQMFARADQEGQLETAIYNPSFRVRSPVAELEPDMVRRALEINAYGGFLMGREATTRMKNAGGGNILFTGASASVKGFALSATFAMGKFALRGLAQSMARELAPENIHVAHIVIDGGIRSDHRPPDPDAIDALLDPDAIAQNYLMITRQQRSAWTWEIELRPWVERF